MLQKLAVIREARETLNDMRTQHQEKMRQQELEQEMLRRMQMEQKLELMRQQKQEYLIISYSLNNRLPINKLLVSHLKTVNVFKTLRRENLI